MHKIICHRGINREKENTYASITEVINIKKNDLVTYGVEFDIQITKDNNIICYHDATLERLHNDTTKIINMTINEIAKYDLPYFENVIAKLSLNPNLLIDIELKTYNSTNQNKINLFCKQTLEICNKYNILNQCVFSSFDDDILLELLKVNKFIKVGKIADSDYDFKNINQLLEAGISSFIMDKSIVVNVINKYGDILPNIELYVYTLYCIHDPYANYDDNMIKFLIKKNIGLITDDYARMTEFVLNY